MDTPSKYRSADERRAETVEAVVSMAAEQNPSSITTAAIAERMQVSQGALFRHFPTKEAIFEAVIGWVAERILSRVDAAIDAANSPTAALHAVFMTHIQFVVEHPGVPRMLFGELQHARLTAPKLMAQGLIARYTQRLALIMDSGKANGEFDPALDTAAAASLFIGSIQGLVMQSLLLGDTQYIATQAPPSFALILRAIERTHSCHD
jgi:AcrR family transcriptional regulator